MEIVEKRSDMVMLSFVVYDFSSCIDHAEVARGGRQVDRSELNCRNQSLIG